MTSDRIRVGIIGASPDRGWAATAHIPALRALPGYEITAVSTSRAESAREAARQFGVAHSFTDPDELAGHPDVDLVTVTVKVPAHARLINAALAAGKHVYTEWPLALDTAEAQALLATAEKAGVHHVIGVQARYSPVLNHARQLIADGYVGRVTSVTGYVAVPNGARGEIAASSAYTLDRATGAGVVPILGGHTLDALEYLLGELTDVSAQVSTQRETYTIAGTDQVVTATGPSNLMVNATLAGGAVVALHAHIGKVSGGQTRVEISGTDADLSIESHGPAAGYGIQIADLRLRGARSAGEGWQDLPVAGQAGNAVPALVGNIAGVYTAIAEDLRNGTRHAPDFAAGLRLHRLLDKVWLAAETGTRQPVIGG
jgi:predicted dehydrogenase